MDDLDLLKKKMAAIVTGAYDLQKQRIGMGNRLVAVLKHDLGQDPGKSEEEISPEGQKILEELRKAHRRITDGVVKLPARKKFRPDELIADYTTLVMTDAYIKMLESEEAQFKEAGALLPQFPIYEIFLKNVKGCGDVISANIIARIDIHKAKKPSSLWAYCGLDVATRFRCVERFTDDAPETVDRRHPSGWETEGPAMVGDGFFKLMRPTDHPTSPRQVVGHYAIDKEWSAYGEGRSRKQDHLRDWEYTDKAGNPAIRKGITFNPILKTKIRGVLATSFLRSGSPYREYYDKYKAKIAADPRHAEKTKAHLSNMALRFMCKVFLEDLYFAWRRLEKLPVVESYRSEKLKLK